MTLLKQDTLINYNCEGFLNWFQDRKRFCKEDNVRLSENNVSLSYGYKLSHFVYNMKTVVWVI